VRGELDTGGIGRSVEGALTAVLERQRSDGLHDGAQIYVSLAGRTLVDTVVGESAPGRPLRTDDVMLWYSSGKPLTAVAVLQLWERGQLSLDDRLTRFLPGWGNGKERATVRHVLTHTGGFPMYGDAGFDGDIPAEEALARVIAAPASWDPGTKAGYHPVSGWKALGAVVEAVDGRPIARYLADEVLAPLGCTESSLGVTVVRQRALGDRLVPVAWKGHMFPHVDPDGGLRMIPYRVDEIHNQPWHVAKVEPGASMRGPAKELGRFYESLLGHGPKLLEPRTVELLGAVHRIGLKDALFGYEAPWGLGVAVAMTGGAGRRAFGHGGMASSRGMCDPDVGLVMVLVCNGLPNPLAAEARLAEVTDTLYTALSLESALGDEAARVRLPFTPGRATLLAT
jgi:CubicO group peptidase (beta-lactamase class C family)